MNDQIKKGKTRTISISISVLLVSLFTIYLYHAVRPEIENKKLIQQCVRFILTIGLLVATYQGKNWARITSIVLFSLAILGALYGLFTMDISLINKSPFIVMTFVYSMAVYHFAFSPSFKAFFSYQN